MGIEIGDLIERGKPVICLYKKGKNPGFTLNIHSEKLLMYEYSEDNIKEVLAWAFEDVEQLLKRRFTFFISSEIDSFLYKIAKDKGTSRSEFIRGLIDREMERKSE